MRAFLPNAVSAVRLPLAAAFVAADGVLARSAILALAALSDFLDGWLARRLGQMTRAGELLDPLADKIFLVAALASFAAADRLEMWQLAALLARDIFTVAGFTVVVSLRLPVRLRARMGGKIVTVIQLAAVLVLLVRPAWVTALALAAAAVGLYAVLDYARAGLIALRSAERRR